MFLLDTNVLSETRKGLRGNGAVVRWFRGVGDATLYVSALTIMELEIGVLSMERRDARQGRAMREWLRDHVLKDFERRILPVDQAIAQRAAKLQVPDRRPYTDSLIAATALEHHLTVVTRNVRDFEGTDVQVLNPFDPMPGLQRTSQS